MTVGNEAAGLQSGMDRAAMAPSVRSSRPAVISSTTLFTPNHSTRRTVRVERLRRKHSRTARQVTTARRDRASHRRPLLLNGPCINGWQSRRSSFEGPLPGLTRGATMDRFGSSAAVARLLVPAASSHAGSRSVTLPCLRRGAPVPVGRETPLPRDAAQVRRPSESCCWPRELAITTL